jgi:hypothetical protein
LLNQERITLRDGIASLGETAFGNGVTNGASKSDMLFSFWFKEYILAQPIQRHRIINRTSVRF